MATTSTGSTSIPARSSPVSDQAPDYYSPPDPNGVSQGEGLGGIDSRVSYDGRYVAFREVTGDNDVVLKDMVTGVSERMPQSFVYREGGHSQPGGDR